jgi:putative membrane protein insertion efficiency factor
MRRLALIAIRLYQWSMSPYLRGYCRHNPTCSNYTYQAISKYGAVKGIWLGVRRLSRCRPLGTSGYDPVP